MSTDGNVGAALLKVGVTLIERTVPKGLAYVTSFFSRKKVLVVGQARAGKSTFVDYLQHGLFEDEKARPKTYDVERTPQFKVEVGRDKTLQLTLQSVEAPGQYGAVAHANLAFNERPHGLLIFTDLTTPLEGEEDRASGAWLTAFCERLESLRRLIPSLCSS